jgi:NADH-quinone oxidoreductase subunit N
VLALTFALFLLGQLGAPFTSGFVAKVQVLSAAADAGFYWLALVAMVASVISAYLYLKVIVAMYMSSDEDAATARAGGGRSKVPFAAALSLSIAAVVTLLIGFLPGLLDDLSEGATPVAVE